MFEDGVGERLIEAWPAGDRDEMLLAEMAGDVDQARSIFLAAIEEIAGASSRLIRSLETSAAPKNREEEAARAKARAAERFGA